MRLPKVVGVRHGRLEKLITKKSFVKHLHEGTLGHIVETSNDEALAAGGRDRDARGPRETPLSQVHNCFRQLGLRMVVVGKSRWTGRPAFLK